MSFALRCGAFLETPLSHHICSITRPHRTVLTSPCKRRNRLAGVCIWHEEVLTVEEFVKDFELEAWGEGELAYIKQLKAKDVAELFPQLGGFQMELISTPSFPLTEHQWC